MSTTSDKGVMPPGSDAEATCGRAHRFYEQFGFSLLGSQTMLNIMLLFAIVNYTI